MIEKMKSSPDTDRMLSLALEIEGLILLIQRRGDLVHPGVMEILRGKIASLSELAGIEPAAQEMPANPAAPAVAAADPEAAAEQEMSAAEAQAEAVAEQETPEVMAAVEEANDEAIADNALFEGEEDAGMQPAKTIADSKPTFTLNDKFLFRNELFDGDETAFDDALCAIASFSTAREVEEYVTDDLCFDPNDPTVAAFLASVTAGK